MRRYLPVPIGAALLSLMLFSSCAADEVEYVLPGGVQKTSAPGTLVFAARGPGHSAEAGPAPEKGHPVPKALPRAVGDPCTSDSQCGGDKCLDVYGLSQNYCTQPCESAGCPGGSSCYKFSVGAYCLKDCSASSQCHSWLICDHDYTCWTGDNPVDPGADNRGELGDPCSQDNDCAGGACLEKVAGEGYCSQRCEYESCPQGAVCWPFGIGRHCLKGCTASTQCHPWLICDQDQTCWPGDNPIEDSPPVDDPPEPDPVPEGSAIGGPCETAADCRDEGAYCYPYTLNDNPTGFMGGYCLINGCSGGGCPDGSICKAIYAGGGKACVPTCANNAECRSAEGYACVAWTGDDLCWPSCSAASCPSGYSCDPGKNHCVPSAPDVPDPDPPPTTGPFGAVPSCPDLPPRSCSGAGSYCAELLPFEPDEGPGYVDYPLNGESWNNQYRSYARRDLIILVKWAAAWVDCKAKAWGGGNGHPLGLGDMSEASGAIPGTSDGDPGHPSGSHTNGRDMDIAYYQNVGSDNYLKPVCPHGGQYHCTGAPNKLDVWRTALFLGALLSSSRTRVIGVDGKIGPLVESAIDTLESGGWLPEDEWGAQGNLAYETVNNGNGWYYFHHHHLHVSLWGGSGKPGVATGAQCLTPDCGVSPHPDHHAGCRVDAVQPPPQPALPPPSMIP